jgi:hypothetical protein
MIGNPESYRICTSIVERGNLSIRTSAPSHALNECLFQEVEHLKAMLPLYSGYYNFCRIHLSIRCTPANGKRITGHIWELRDLACNSY